MAKPVSGQLGYDNAADRPTVELRTGTKKLLTEDDAGGGGAVSDVTSGSAAITVSPTTGNVVVSLDESELESGGGQELSVAGLSGRLADPQDADVLATPGGDADITGDTGTSGQVLTSDGSGNWSMQSPPQMSEFWWPPAAANADDYEFTGSSLPVGWSGWSPTTNAAATRDTSDPDWFSSPAAGQFRAKVGQRTSWLTLQAGHHFSGSGDQQYYYYHPLANSMSNSGDYMWRTRIRGTVITSAGSGDWYGACQIAFFGDNGGVPANVNSNGVYLRFGWQTVAGAPSTPRLEARGWDGSVSGFHVTSNLDSKQFNGDGELVVLRRNGSGWYFYWVPASGFGTYLLGGAAQGGGPFPSQLAYVGFYFGGGQGAVPGRPLILVDYLRRENQVNFF